MNKIFSFCVLTFFIATDIYSYIWTRTLGGAGKDCGYSICFAQDSGYILAGYTESYGAGMTDGWLIKTDTFGIPLWSKTFGGTDSDCIYSVTKTMDSGYVMVGSTKSFGGGGSDVWFIKTDAMGDTIWTRTYGDLENECVYSVINTIDSGYIAVGARNSGEYAWLLKVDTNGDTVWTKTFKKYGYGRCIQLTNDSGYIITGYSDSLVAGKTVSWLIKTDANGDTLWTKTYGNDSYLYSVVQTEDSGYVMTGAKTDSMWLVKTDFTGKTTLDYPVLGICGTGYSVAEASNGQYIITGSGTTTPYPFIGFLGDCYTDSSGVMILNTNGNCGEDLLGYFGGKYANGAYAFVKVSNSVYNMVGYTDSYGEGKRDLWLIRTDTWKGRYYAIEETSSDKNSSPSISVFPNPITTSARITLSCNFPKAIKLTLYDISGREKMLLFSGNIKTKNTLTLNTNSLVSGKYFLKMETDGKRTIKGITIVK